MKFLYKLFDDLSNNKLAMKIVDLHAPVNLTSSEACLSCGPDSNYKKKVCSADGNAWCCEIGSNHPLCRCDGIATDFVYCPSSLGCGPTFFNFTDGQETITANLTNKAEIKLCSYEIGSNVTRVINLKTNNYMTVLDPEQSR